MDGACGYVVLACECSVDVSSCWAAVCCCRCFPGDTTALAATLARTCHGFFGGLRVPLLPHFCALHSLTARLPPHRPHTGKPPPFQAQGSPAIPLLAVLALLVLAFSNLQTVKASAGGDLVAAGLQAPTVLLQQVAAPLLLALAVLALVMKKGKYLCDRPTLLPDAAVPWH